MKLTFSHKTNFKSARIATLRISTFFLLLNFTAGIVPAQRAITNPSIEDPAFGNGQVVFHAEGTVPGWLTSHPVQPGACDGADCRPFERWSSGATGVLPATGSGLRWVELNAFVNSMIYQSVCMTNGESFGYSFVHRGRGSDTTADVAQFRMGIPTGLPAGSKPADLYDIPIATVSTENDGGGAAPTAHPNATVTFADATNGWRRYSGTFAYTGTTQVVNIGYVAISAAGGNPAVGNFIDDWQISLSPYLEFSPASASGPEGTVVAGGSNTPANRPAFRIGGTLAGPVTVNFQVAGGSATIGTDYSMTEPFQAGNTTPTATVTIPAGTYDGTSADSLFPIPFSINTDFFVEPDETVEFTITSAPPGTTIASVLSCGTPPIMTSSYTIVNDDIITAAPVMISGQVLDLDGGPIMNARLRLTSTMGETYSASTNPFGHFRFDQVPSGTTYVLETSAKGHSFEPQTMAVNDDITGLVITPTGAKSSRQ